MSQTGEPLFSKDYNGETIDTLYFDLPEACFNLVVSDTYGDGICCDVGEGFYELWYLDVLMVEGAISNSRRRHHSVPQQMVVRTFLPATIQPCRHSRSEHNAELHLPGHECM